MLLRMMTATMAPVHEVFGLAVTVFFIAGNPNAIATFNGRRGPPLHRQPLRQAYCRPRRVPTPPADSTAANGCGGLVNGGKAMG
ncbi:hypothetical protein E2562_015023 [Oryza meyeriana var. granulata]|uniref:Uncharacterized protein n=1 Tax=Oryza meyeriana var. granulata TaxID=110450 RepID=A0A6G1EIR4_9ORYZ|nr:hypothetical protein E2562_015023 [Oryza meyeriana var. granulata]